MTGRRYGTRDTWRSLSTTELASAELREAAERAGGKVEAYQVHALEGERPLSLEVLWLMDSRRAAIATSDEVFWTDTPTIETALHRWAGDYARGTRSQPRAE